MLTRAEAVSGAEGSAVRATSGHSRRPAGLHDGAPPPGRRGGTEFVRGDMCTWPTVHARMCSIALARARVRRLRRLEEDRAP
jgi:hypothetical protein